jgi:hypothetical protein
MKSSANTAPVNSRMSKSLASMAVAKGQSESTPKRTVGPVGTSHRRSGKPYKPAWYERWYEAMEIVLSLVPTAKSYKQRRLVGLKWSANTEYTSKACSGSRAP